MCPQRKEDIQCAWLRRKPTLHLWRQRKKLQQRRGPKQGRPNQPRMEARLRSQRLKPLKPNERQLTSSLCLLGDCTVLNKYFLPSFILQMSFIGLFWACT